MRPGLHRSLRTMVLAEFSSRSLLHWEFSWARPATVRLPGWGSETEDDGPETALEAAVEAAVADHPDTERLRALLPPAAIQNA
ncbi:hypothetical protein [Streptomyces echinatus]|uniref:Uncharacterized protein n=1 Tax=Streptomyces echinatus TaxID=67293 RepID=A0A7W9UQM4_9ACTN|nr:hypothetical protein [Streptomyces echinatus]MBB5927555.1 hypothetical protein [Streptomyces echinatus]